MFGVMDTDIEKNVERFITENFYVAESIDLDARTSLFDMGIVDSTGLLEVVAFLEKEFGIEVLDDEVIADNLDTVERISAYVERKTRRSEVPQHGEMSVRAT